MCDENRITNAAFLATATEPVPETRNPTVFRDPQVLTPLIRNPTSCFRCGQNDHLHSDCPFKYDTRFMTIEEKEQTLQQLLADIQTHKTQIPSESEQVTKVTEVTEVAKKQDVKPLLESNNRFTCLSSESTDSSEVNDSDSTDELTEDKQTPSTSRPRIPKWERRLPNRYVVASTPTARSLNLKVEIQTTDFGEVFATDALVDCGATGLFIDTEYVKKKCLTVRTLARAIPVYNVDGTPNEAGSINGIVDVVLRYKGHMERAQFAVTGLGKQNMILGYTSTLR